LGVAGTAEIVDEESVTVETPVNGAVDGAAEPATGVAISVVDGGGRCRIASIVVRWSVIQEDHDKESEHSERFLQIADALAELRFKLLVWVFWRSHEWSWIKLCLEHQTRLKLMTSPMPE